MIAVAASSHRTPGHGERRIIPGEHQRHDALSAKASYRPTCAICGGREATTRTEWDGRDVPACEGCLEEAEYVDDEGEKTCTALAAAAVSAVLLSAEGMRLSDVLSAVGVEVNERLRRESQEYNAVARALYRAVSKGEIAVAVVELRGPRPSGSPSGESQRILDELDRGATPDDIARLCGVTVSAVYKARRRWRPTVRVYCKPERRSCDTNRARHRPVSRLVSTRCAPAVFTRLAD